MEIKALGYSFDVELAGLALTYDPEYRRSDVMGNVLIGLFEMSRSYRLGKADKK